MAKKKPHKYPSFLTQTSAHSVNGLKAEIYGGPGSVGRAKYKRPLDENSLTHVALTSTVAKGAYAFRSHRDAIEETLRERAEDSGVKLDGFEIHGQHLHIFLSFKRREQFQRFMRTTTGMLARRITGAKKGKPFGRKFWDHLAFTRTIETRDGAVENFTAELKR